MKSTWFVPLSCVLAIAGLGARAHADPVFLTYALQGAYSDGTTFSGTFGYDPVLDLYTYVDPFGPTEIRFGIFDLALTRNGMTNHIVSATETGIQPPDGYSDAGSIATRLRIVGGGHYSFSDFIFDWTKRLNGPDGGARQALTGAWTSYSNCNNPECTVTSREIVSGFVEGPAPVPLPAAAWLLASGVGLAGYLRRRR